MCLNLTRPYAMHYNNITYILTKNNKKLPTFILRIGSAHQAIAPRFPYAVLKMNILPVLTYVLLISMTD